MKYYNCTFSISVPPSYEDAMALCDKFIDDIEYLHSAASTASIDSTHRIFDFKPRYPVYYNFTTPIIPPGSNENSNISLNN